MLMISTFTINAIFNFVIGLMIAKFLGPADFGRYALAQSIGIVFNILFIDWLRHCATRFFKNNFEGATIRVTLEMTLALCSLAICVVAGIGIACGINFGLSLSLIVIAPLMGLASGLFDFSTAILRSEFQNKPYAQIIIVRNSLSLILVGLAVVIFKSAALALAALSLSSFLALASIWKALRPVTNFKAKPDFALTKMFVHYALPIVIANVLLQGLPLLNRTLLAQSSGFDAAGQYSLAYDLGSRVMAAIGSAIDILLLQLAIRADHELGVEGAKLQLSRNLVTVFALMTPLCLGLWLVLPSFAHVFIPEAFSVAFVRVFESLLPGFFALAMLFFALHQVFYVARRTWPLSVAALLALTMNTALVLAFKTTDPIVIAMIQSASMVTALGLGCIFVSSLLPISLNYRDIGSIILAAVLMLCATWAMRNWTPSFITLLSTTLVGGSVYSGTLWVLNAFDFRKKLMVALK